MNTCILEVYSIIFVCLCIECMRDAPVHFICVRLNKTGVWVCLEGSSFQLTINLCETVKVWASFAMFPIVSRLSGDYYFNQWGSLKQYYHFVLMSSQGMLNKIVTNKKTHAQLVWCLGCYYMLSGSPITEFII